MKSLVNLCAGVCLSAVLFIAPSAVQAQQAPDPLEIVTCNFINGSDAGDLEAPMSDLNEWMDEHNLNNFNISTLTPVFTSNAFEYDFLFFNRWIDGNALGQNMTAFFGPDGGDALAGFADVVDCSSTTAFAAVLIDAPATSRNGGPIQFFNCTARENRTVGEAIGAINTWVEAEVDTNAASGAGHAVLFPIAGENPAATYDFKWVVLFESFQAYGDSLDDLFAPGGPSLADTIDPVMDCDSARLYNQVINRSAQAEN